MVDYVLQIYSIDEIDVCYSLFIRLIVAVFEHSFFYSHLWVSFIDVIVTVCLYVWNSSGSGTLECILS